jgi:glycyl-tRNA synthetase beta chain
MPRLLLEVGVEEIPDWMIEPALESLGANLAPLIEKLGGGQAWTDATPRRLVYRSRYTLDQERDEDTLVQGPSLSAGEKAAAGFARKMGVPVTELSPMDTGKGLYFSIKQRKMGLPARELLATALPAAIAGIQFPKTMHWGGKDSVRFIRPIRWVLALLDDEIIPFDIAGVPSGDWTYGHRVLGSKGPIQITIGEYDQMLRDNYVVVRASDRESKIRAGLGAGVRPDPELLKTLVYLTEFPTTIRGSFDPQYLELPEEILATVMRHHQRYFTVEKPDGSLAPEFVAVTNTNGDQDGLIRKGNERVLRARFNDARFFWRVDQQKKLSARVDDLAKVTFQAKLGSYKEKAERVQQLAVQMAAQVGADENTVSIATLLAKCDLTTEMVKEFTELQGLVGGLYAREQGEGEAVATAIYDHYKPVSMEDSIPRTLEGQVVALADKIDTLRECFRVGLIPTGSKDPFALRRAAQGVVKILAEARLPIDLFAFAERNEELLQFLQERVAHYLREVKGFPYDEVNAVTATKSGVLMDVLDRLTAVHDVRPTPNFEPLAASFKRIENILKQAEAGEAGTVRQELLAPGPEQDLYEAFLRIRSDMAKGGSYAAKLTSIASLRPQVDLFFDKILVNDPDAAIRRNRLALLASLLTEFSTIADFSAIVAQGGNAQS